MSPDQAAELVRSALVTSLLAGAPILVAVLVVSLVVNVLQTATQLQDHTLSFIPRLLTAGVAVVLVLPWLLGRLVEYSTELYSTMPAGM